MRHVDVLFLWRGVLEQIAQRGVEVLLLHAVLNAIPSAVSQTYATPYRTLCHAFCATCCATHLVTACHVPPTERPPSIAIETTMAGPNYRIRGARSLHLALPDEGICYPHLAVPDEGIGAGSLRTWCGRHAGRVEVSAGRPMCRDRGRVAADVYTIKTGTTRAAAASDA